MFGVRLSLRSVYCRGRTLEIGVCHPKLQPLTLLTIYHFWQKSYAFRIHSIDKWYPSRIPSLQLPFLSLLTAVNALSLKMNKHKSEHFVNFFTAIKCFCLPFWAFLPTKMTDFLALPYTERVKSLPFHIPEAWKRYPFWVEPPHIGHFRKFNFCPCWHCLPSVILR